MTMIVDHIADSVSITYMCRCDSKPHQKRLENLEQNHSNNSSHKTDFRSSGCTMARSFDVISIPKIRPMSRLAWVVLLSIFQNDPRASVLSFQPPMSPFKHNNFDAMFNQKRLLKSNRNRHYSLPRFLDNNSTGVGEKSNESDLKAKTDTELEEIEGEPDYCYVNLDDISEPYMSREDSESTFIEYTDDGLVLPAGPVGQFKEDIANFLNEPTIEVMIAATVLLNSLLVALSTLDSIDYLFPYIRTLQIVVGSIFLADFQARWFSSSKENFGFVLNPQFFIDVLVVIFPLVVSVTPSSIWQEVTWLPSTLVQPSGLYNLQLLRVLRLGRFLEDLETFERFAGQAIGGSNLKRGYVQEWQLQLARVALSLFTLISVATGLIYAAEHTVNPNINNYFDALYFGLTTLTTVGFGDVSPVTSQGKLIVCGSIVFGVAVVPGQAAALLEALLDRENLQKGRTVNGRSSLLIGAQKSSLVNHAKESPLALDTTASCSQCGASFHWASASYCYKCGAKFDEPS